MLIIYAAMVFECEYARSGEENNVNLHYNFNPKSKTLFYREFIMTTLSITSRGQVTLRREILQHLGILPGQKIELDLLPDGRGVIQAAKATQSIDNFIGLLAGKTQKVATIEEINAATAQAWAGQ